MEIGKQKVPVNLKVQYLSFSAHADAKGIMQLISQCRPKNVVLVHGEKAKMSFLCTKIVQEFNIPCFFPPNGTSISMAATMDVPLSINSNLYEKQQAVKVNSLDEFLNLRSEKPIDGIAILESAQASLRKGRCAGGLSSE